MLSGRSAYDSGTLTLNGEVLDSKSMKKFKKQIAYVKQDDLFFGHLTVRDQLTYTALLRMPSSWTKQQKLTKVESVINELRLNKCVDSPIFAVSGGERKRVNIGTELLTNPALVILDEPTSGLDSTSAVALIKVLHNLATKSNKTIITSIHQPSSAVFAGFSKLSLLADGHLVYFGTPQASLPYCESLGFPCPNGYNLADHWMDLLIVDSAVDEPVDNVNDRQVKQMTARQKLINCWDNESFSNQIQTEAGEHEFNKSILQDDSFDTTWITQYLVLLHRSLKNSRSSIFTVLNIIKSAAIGIMAGLLWFQMPYTEKAIFDRSSYFFFTMTFWVFDSMFSAFLAFPSERPIIFKERASGSYHLSAYYLAKTTSEAPAHLTLPAIYMVISYWLSGVNNNFSIFIASVLCTLLSVMAGESIGLFVGTTILDVEKGMVVMTVVSLALMVVGGFFVKDSVPVFMKWLSYLSPFKYSYNGSVQLIFDKPIPCDGSDYLPYCVANPGGQAPVEDVLQSLGVTGSVAFNSSMLIVMFVLLRIASFYALKGKKADERTI